MDTHLAYFSTPYYSNYNGVLPLITGLGVRHIRDSLDNHGSAIYTQRILQLAQLGIHLDAGTVVSDTQSSIHAALALMPNAVEAVEGPNEYDLTGAPNWIERLRSFQQTLYAAVKSAPKGDSYSVWGPSITSYRDTVALGDLGSYLDLGTMHNYFGNLNPGTAGGTPFPVGKYNSEAFWMGTGHIISGGKPLVTTETGYETETGSNGWVTPSVQARYALRELFLQWNAKVERTYFYELLDEGGQWYGFVDANLTKKPAYTALANLLHKLSDAGPAFALKPLTYTLTAVPTVAHTLLQKRDGSYRFMCWDEVPQADPVTPKQTVTLNSATRFRIATQYQWQDDGSFTTIPLTQSKSGVVTFTVTDRPSEVKLQP
jgi:hypothetical protein